MQSLRLRPDKGETIHIESPDGSHTVRVYLDDSDGATYLMVEAHGGVLVELAVQGAAVLFVVPAGAGVGQRAT